METIINPDQAAGAAAPDAIPDTIKDSDARNFARDVIDASRSVPVIVDFWAPWCGPCKQLGPLIERLVTQAGGAVRLVKINVDENQSLAQQLKVQSIPAVFAFKNGQPVDAFVGAQSESQIRAFIARLSGDAGAPLNDAVEQAKALMNEGDTDTAGQIISQVLSHDATHPGAIACLIRIYTAQGQLDEAGQLVSGLADDITATPDVTAAIAALELAANSGDGGDIEALREKIAADPADHAARSDLASALYGTGDTEAAIDHLLEIISRDRAWNDDAARRQLLKILEALGFADPRAVAARRRLSTILFS